MKLLQIKRQLLLFILILGNAIAQTPNVTIPDINASAGKDVNLDIQVSDVKQSPPEAC